MAAGSGAAVVVAGAAVVGAAVVGAGVVALLVDVAFASAVVVADAFVGSAGEPVSRLARAGRNALICSAIPNVLGSKSFATASSIFHSSS